MEANPKTKIPQILFTVYQHVFNSIYILASILNTPYPPPDLLHPMAEKIKILPSTTEPKPEPQPAPTQQSSTPEKPPTQTSTEGRAETTTPQPSGQPAAPGTVGQTPTNASSGNT